MSSTHLPPILLNEPRLRSRRRAHKRSRHGCGNCRLRRVKCDEGKPGCEKCRQAHITCAYAAEAIHLQSSHEQAVACVPLITPQFSSNKTTLGTINRALYDYYSKNPDMGHVVQLSLQDLSLLLQFRINTLHCIGSQWDASICEKELVRLASLNPYLLHVVLTCTAMHDRYLGGQSHSKRTEYECYHWALSAQLFNHEISRNSRSYDKDAIWMTATLNNWMVLFAVETKNPNDVWPLSPAISNIPWYPIQKGLRSIWQLAGPNRTNSLFFTAASNNRDERCLGLPPPEPGIDGIPMDLVELCGLDESSNSENNPYHTAVRTLSTLIKNPSPRPDSLKFLGFVNTIDDGFEAMLRERDPRALLLMSIWYGLVPKSLWWISLRAELERRAICIYLDRYHANDLAIQGVLAAF